MTSIRIGNDIRIEWPLTIGDDIAALDNLQVSVEVSQNIPRENPCRPQAPPTLHRLEMTMLGNLGVLKRIPCGADGKECPPPTNWQGGPIFMEDKRPMPIPPMQLPCYIEGDKIVALWTADRQIFLGEYDVTLHIRRNGMGCATADQSRAIRLVAHSGEADVSSDSGVETVVTMQSIALSLVGLSAYEIALLNGFSGTQEEWLASLKGEKGDKGEQGEKGDEFTDEQKAVIKHITEGDYMVGFDLFYDSDKLRARQVYGSKADTYLPVAAATTSHAGVMTATDKANLDKLWKAANPLTLSVSGGGIYEKGTTQEVIVKWTVKSGSDDVTSQSTLTVNDTDVSGTTQASFTGVTSTTTYTVKAVFDGDTVSKSVSATFVNRSYFGVVSSEWAATEANVKALGTSVLKNSKGYDTAAFSQSSQKNVYAYPKSFGALTSITDGKNEFLGSYTLYELTVNGETYYVYVLAEPSTVTSYKLKFV